MTITAATLFLQIALTKFFSFRLWYHYAFMIISITMLGLSAASAVWRSSSADCWSFRSHAFCTSARCCLVRPRWRRSEC